MKKEIEEYSKHYYQELDREQRALERLRKSKPLSHWWLDADCVPTFKSMKNCPTCGKPFVRVGWTWLHQDSPLHRAWKELDNA